MIKDKCLVYSPESPRKACLGATETNVSQVSKRGDLPKERYIDRVRRRGATRCGSSPANTAGRLTSDTKRARGGWGSTGIHTTQEPPTTPPYRGCTSDPGRARTITRLGLYHELGNLVKKEVDFQQVSGATIGGLIRCEADHSPPFPNA